MMLTAGATIGIMGGGQLGRMLAMSAAQLGFRAHIFCPQQDSVAAEVAGAATVAGYDDMTALSAFARAVDVITFEFENVPVGPLQHLDSAPPIHPPLAALSVAQDRAREKAFARRHGARPADHLLVTERASLEGALAQLGLPAILKTCRFGYDGRGQARIASAAEADAAWDAIGGGPAVLERVVDFAAEFSVIAVRGTDGELRFYDSPRNEHRAGVLASSTLPAASVPPEQISSARAELRALAEALDYVGVVTCEYFATADRPIFNEMAPRVHNSGHWTIEGAVTSQFENHIRAVAGLPLGATDALAPSIRMENILAGSEPDVIHCLTEPDAHLHLYGKQGGRPGRKLGHITRIDRPDRGCAT